MCFTFCSNTLNFILYSDKEGVFSYFIKRQIFFFRTLMKRQIENFSNIFISCRDIHTYRSSVLAQKKRKEKKGHLF